MAVIGAAGGLGQGILSVCRAEDLAFTAVVRSRPERVTDVPDGSSVVVVTSLADRAALTDAFSGADAVVTAIGVTSGSSDRSALLSANMASVGRAAAEQQAVVDALGSGAFSSLRRTLVRAGVNSRGKDERPVASAEWDGTLNSWWPLSYQAMGRWMLEEAASNEFVRVAPVVSRRRK